MKLTCTWSHEQVSSFSSLIHSILESLALITLVETFWRRCGARASRITLPVKTNRFMIYYINQSINFYSRHRGPYRQHSTDIYINIKQYKTFKNEADKASLKHIQASGPLLPKARCIPCITLRNISYGHNDHILRPYQPAHESIHKIS